MLAFHDCYFQVGRKALLFWGILLSVFLGGTFAILNHIYGSSYEVVSYITAVLLIIYAFLYSISWQYVAIIMSSQYGSYLVFLLK